jgi:integrase
VVGSAAFPDGPNGYIPAWLLIKGDIAMPRLTRSVPSYRKHKVSGQAFVELSGRRHYLGPYGTQASKAVYDRLVAEWLVNGRQSPVNDEALTIIELCDRYRRFAEAYYVKNGQPTCLHRIKQALKSVRQHYGRDPATTFGPLALKVVRQQMIDRGLSRQYINDLIDCIRRMFKWAAAEQLVPASVPQSLAMVAGLRRGKTQARETEPITPVDDETVALTLRHVPEIVADMVRVQRLTGMRPQEVCLLRPVDLDRSGEIWIFRPESHKSEHHGRQRSVPIGPQAQSILLRYLARDADMYCFRPVDSEAKRRAAQHAARKTPISCGNRPGTNVKPHPKVMPGDRYDVAAYRRAIHRGCDKAFPHPTLSTIKEADLNAAQLEEKRKWQSSHRWSPNRLRHTAGTAVRKRFGLEAAQVILGHAAANVTEVYAERDLAKGIEVARLIG